MRYFPSILAVVTSENPRHLQFALFISGIITLVHNNTNFGHVMWTIKQDHFVKFIVMQFCKVYHALTTQVHYYKRLQLTTTNKKIYLSSLSTQGTRWQDTKTIVCKDTITTLRTDQVLVWSQTTDQESTTATTFVMTPCKKGTIENFETPPPLPPLGKTSNTHGGVPCEGEPAIDPSRTMQQIGDSEWLEEFDR